MVRYTICILVVDGKKNKQFFGAKHDSLKLHANKGDRQSQMNDMFVGNVSPALFY